ncbi:hypothetical protein BV25DRAFT_1729125 [Artomyces pyxidatus]|uniref:Uncharacterized protein n=1 Tax=Artomyces pyxidatus TaxID=48021 RepID=A0ACB8SH43_9AGAM|nr:hypothetical protein BV25DRAFT_1729125 [Artomyces pyxidatus]
MAYPYRQCPSPPIQFALSSCDRGVLGRRRPLDQMVEFPPPQRARPREGIMTESDAVRGITSAGTKNRCRWTIHRPPHRLRLSVVVSACDGHRGGTSGTLALPADANNAQLVPRSELAHRYRLPYRGNRAVGDDLAVHMPQETLPYQVPSALLVEQRSQLPSAKPCVALAGSHMRRSGPATVTDSRTAWLLRSIAVSRLHTNLEDRQEGRAGSAFPSGERSPERRGRPGLRTRPSWGLFLTPRRGSGCAVRQLYGREHVCHDCLSSARVCGS